MFYGHGTHDSKVTFDLAQESVKAIETTGGQQLCLQNTLVHFVHALTRVHFVHALSRGR